MLTFGPKTRLEMKLLAGLLVAVGLAAAQDTQQQQNVITQLHYSLLSTNLFHYLKIIKPIISFD